MGSKAFEVMKNMSKGDIKRFLELTKNDEDPEYPYRYFNASHCASPSLVVETGF